MVTTKPLRARRRRSQKEKPFVSLCLCGEVSSSGFTLIEVLVASAIFMVAVLPLLAVLANGAVLNRAQELFVGSCLISLEAEKAHHSRAVPESDTTYQVGPRQWSVQRATDEGPLRKIHLAADTPRRTVTEASILLYAPSADTTEPSE